MNKKDRIERLKSDILSYMPPDDLMKSWSKIINVDPMGIPYDKLAENDNMQGDQP